MKRLAAVLLPALLLSSCDKDQQNSPAKPDQQSKAVENGKPAIDRKALPPVPEGKLPRMDPEKAKFIAVPSTPKDPAPEKVVVKPVPEEKTVPKHDAEAPKTNTPPPQPPPAVSAPVPQVAKPVPVVEKPVPAVEKPVPVEVKKADKPATEAPASKK